MLGRVIYVVAYTSNLFFCLCFAVVCGMNLKYLDVINTAAINSPVPSFCWTHALISLVSVYRCGIAGSQDKSIFNYTK